MHAVECVFFTALPGVPCENRWTAFYPFLCWTLLLFMLFQIGARAWLKAFGGDATCDEDANETGLEPEALFRVLNGKRMRRCTAMARDVQNLVLRGLVTMLVGNPLDVFMHLMLRDIGQTRYFDFRARESAMGREWRRLDSPFYTDREASCQVYCKR